MAGLIITANDHRASAASTPFATMKYYYCSPATYTSWFMMTCLLIVFGFIITFRALYSCCYCRFHARVFGRSSLAAIAQSIKASFGGCWDPGRPYSPYSSNYCWSTRWYLLLDRLCRRQCCCCKSIAGSAALASMPFAHDVPAHYFIVRH